MLKCLYWPVKRPWIVNQRFGENTVCIASDGSGNIINCNGKLPPAGYRSLYGADGHKGLDLHAKHGQEVYAAQRGTIYKIDTNPRTGLDVRIESVIAGKRIRHIYEHFLGYQGKVGDVVETGQLIGWADNTGWSSGDHLHFQVEVFEGGTWKAIDPELVLYDIFAGDILALNHKILAIMEWLARQMDRGATRLRQAGRS